MSGPVSKSAFSLAALTLAAAPALAMDGPVETTSGRLQGVPGAVDGVTAYLGVPFAAPPVGDLRWAPPAAPDAWDGVMTADTFGAVCPQPPGQGRVNVSTDLPDSPPQSEDCLTLNVWTPAEAAGEDLPVMVWIYGGAYSEGAGSSPHNHGDWLAEKGVVLVSFNYRLGSLGFMAHPELTAESEHGASGNYALMDSIAVLEWVRDNIAGFGGDPDNVTIFGESAGSAMVAGLVGAPPAEGLFHRGIAESGAWMGLSIAPMVAREQAEARTVAAAERLGVETLAEMRALPAEEARTGLPGAGMIVDGWVIPEDLSITFAEGRQNAVDVLVGSNLEEGSFQKAFGAPPTAEAWAAGAAQRWGDRADLGMAAYPAETDEEAASVAYAPFSDAMAWHMRQFAEAQAAIGQNAYLYHFAHQPPYEEGAVDLGATHTAEIPYVFRTLAAPRVYPDGSSPELSAASPAEHAFADQVSSYWVNFAATGDPNGPGLPEWPPVEDLGPTEAMVLTGEGSGVGPWLSQPKLDLYQAAYDALDLN